MAGDSITDSRMLQAVEKSGGLAIAFNANQYAIEVIEIHKRIRRLVREEAGKLG